MRAKRPRSWKSSLTKVCDNIDFMIEKAERLAYRVVAFISALYGLWAILRFLRYHR